MAILMLMIMFMVMALAIIKIMLVDLAAAIVFSLRLSHILMGRCDRQ